MLFIDLLFALAVAILLAALLVGLTGWRHPRREGAGVAIVFLFILLFAAVWAGGLWFTPFGPPLWGGYWLSYLLVGLFVALIVLTIGAATTPPAAPRPPEDVPATPSEEEAVAGGLAVVFSIFFWIFLVAAVTLIVMAYIA